MYISLKALGMPVPFPSPFHLACSSAIALTWSSQNAKPSQRAVVRVSRPVERSSSLLSPFRLNLCPFGLVRLTRFKGQGEGGSEDIPMHRAEDDLL
jgi:hypothetical protein